MLSAPTAVDAVAERLEKTEAQRTCALDVTADCRPQRPKASSTVAFARGNRVRRAADVVWHVVKLSYCNPMLERPDLVEDDYNRFRNQPRGY